MKHVKDFASWRLNESAGKEKIMDAAEKALNDMSWYSSEDFDNDEIAKGYLSKMSVGERVADLSKYFRFYIKDADPNEKQFLEEYSDAIIQTIAEAL